MFSKTTFEWNKYQTTKQGKHLIYSKTVFNETLIFPIRLEDRIKRQWLPVPWDSLKCENKFKLKQMNNSSDLSAQ